MTKMREGVVTVMAPGAPDRPDRPYPGARHAAQPRPEGADYPTQQVPIQPTGGQTGQARPPASADPEAAGHWFPPGAEGSAGQDWAAGRYPPVRAADAYVPPPEPTAWELAMPDLRNKVANRLHEMSWKHAQAAWERRRKDPIGAHALALFYAEPPHGDPPRCELRTCIRLFLGADEQHLPRLLFEMAGVASRHLRAGGDPRTELVNSCEPMSSSAAYVGIGVSSLDTPNGTWPQVQRTAYSDMDVPGRCWAVLYDGTRIVVDRFAKQNYGQVDIQSTQVLHDVSGQLRRRWRPLNEPNADEDTIYTWRFLRELHEVITSGGGRAR
ncbi:hypothetical protein WEI85_07480 [Actinomycetes bacterium KLBMP 9797]